MRKYWVSGPFFETANLAGGGGGSDAPVDLGTVIENSIADVEGGGTPPPDPNADPEEEKELGRLASEWSAANPNARGHIKIDRHQAVLTRTRNQHAKALEEWAAKEKAWAEREAAIKKQEEEWKGHWSNDPDIVEALQALALADKDQKAFVEMLLKDERFANLIQLKDQQQQQIPSDRPGPNQKAEDGTEYYDDAGLEALLKWHGAQTSSAVEKRLTDAFEKKYGGVAQAFEAATTWNTQLAHAKTQLDAMRKDWPEFAKYENDIKALMDQKGNERMNVSDAYRTVVMAKMLEREKVNRETLRAEILKEMKDKKAAADGKVENRGVERTHDATGDRDIADVIRESIKGLE